VLLQEYWQISVVDDYSRFWSKVNKTDGCWLWAGSTNNGGYGTFRYAGRTVGAHQFVYMQEIGPLVDGLDVCHTCDVRICVRPDHLWQGTRKENLADMTLKGRRVTTIRPQGGENNRAAKLTWELVRQIRQLWDAGKSQIEIQNITGIPRQNIYNVVHNKTWVE
jgi:hypothetical protein